MFPGKKQIDKRQTRLKDKDRNIHSDEVGDYINDFFLNVGNKPDRLELREGNQQNHETGLETEYNDQLLQLEPVTQVEVYNLTYRLNIRKSSGLDNINAKVVKDGLITLNEQFTHIINSSLSQQTFPSEWKKAKVVPIPKHGDPMYVGNNLALAHSR